MKITNQLRATAAGILVIALSNLFSVYMNGVANDSTVVNQAGVVRGGTQRLVKLEMAGRNSDKLVNKLDGLVNGLIKGDRTLGLPRATDPEFLAKMNAVQSSWQKLKEAIATFRQQPSFRSELLTQSEDYFELANDAVNAAEAYSQTKVQRLRVIQLFIFGLNLLILGMILAIARNIARSLLNSTSAIATSSTQIASAVEEQERTVASQAASIRQIEYDDG